MKDSTSFALIKRMLAGLLVMSLSGCNGFSGDSGRRIEDGDSFNIDSAPFIITTSKINDHSLIGNKKMGNVVIVGRDGSLTRRDISSLSSHDISWEEDSLFFSDTDHDYWIDKEGIVDIVESKKTDVGDSVVSLNGGKERLSLYNNGFTSDSIRYDQFDEQIVLATRDKSIMHSYSKWIRNTSICDGSVYGFGLQADPNYQDVAEYHPQLVKLYSDGKFSTDVISHRRSLLGNVNYGVGNFPCLNGHIYMISRNSVLDGRVSGIGLDKDDPELDFSNNLNKSNTGSSDYLYTIEVWDVETGKRRVTPITTQEGGLLANSPDVESYGILDIGHHSLLGEYLYWIDDFLRVNRTNVTTGSTESISLKNPDLDIKTISTKVEFTQDMIYVYIEGHGINGGQKRAYIVAFDIDKGVEAGRYELKGLFENIGETQTVSGFAVNPDPEVAKQLYQ